MSAATAPTAAPPGAAALAVSDGPDGSRVLLLSGHLDTYSIARVWAAARAALSSAPTQPIRIDAAAVDYCDGGGVAMLVDLLREPRQPGAEVSIEGLKPEFQRLLDQFDPQAMREPVEPPPKRVKAVEEVGRAAAVVAHDLRLQVVFVGETAAALWYAVKHPQRVRWNDVWYTCEQVGANALPIVALIAFLLGVILAFQAAVPMRQFGAELFVADLVGLSILRELGPLMTAILLAGRSGAAFAAEIGTIARTLKQRYPNLQQIFLSNRTYAGYATTTLNPEPYAYESGFAVKWVVQAQIDQMAQGSVQNSRAGDLNYQTVAPWIGWGPYLWTRGTAGRSDGLVWTTADVESDGTHPSQSGEQKVGRLLLDFFKTSPVTQCWFLAGASC